MKYKNNLYELSKITHAVAKLFNLGSEHLKPSGTSTVFLIPSLVCTRRKTSWVDIDPLEGPDKCYSVGNSLKSNFDILTNGQSSLIMFCCFIQNLLFCMFQMSGRFLKLHGKRISCELQTPSSPYDCLRSSQLISIRITGLFSFIWNYSCGIFL